MGCRGEGYLLSVEWISWYDEPEIGDVNEGIVEGSENAGNTEDELACLR